MPRFNDMPDEDYFSIEGYLSNSYISKIKREDLGVVFGEFQKEALKRAFFFGSVFEEALNMSIDFDSVYIPKTYKGLDVTKEESFKMSKMIGSVFNDEFVKMIFSDSDRQVVYLNDRFEYRYKNVPMFCKMKGKLDYDIEAHLVTDLKTTSSTSLRTFKDAIKRLGYGSQAVTYMDLSGASRFCFVGISKVNSKVFKYFIDKGSAEYNELAEARDRVIFGHLNCN